MAREIKSIFRKKTKVAMRKYSLKRDSSERLEQLKSHFWNYRPYSTEFVNPETSDDLIEYPEILDEKVNSYYDVMVVDVVGFESISVFPVITGGWWTVNQFLVSIIQKELLTWKRYLVEMEKAETARKWELNGKNIWNEVNKMFSPLLLKNPFQ